MAKESSSDLVQSVCRELLEKRSRFEFRGETAFRSWLYTAALRKILERQRHHRALKRDVNREVEGQAHGEQGDRSVLECYATMATPTRELALQEQMEQIERAFQRLPEEQREVITLAKIVGLPHAEIARSTGRTEAASRQLLRRAMIRLTRLVETGSG
jgi:RNA polymerase sigma-70 factor (ECF subfamily)